MAFIHGKDAIFKLDNAGGSLVDISTYLRSVGGLLGTTPRMDTTTLGATARRREVAGQREGGPISLGGPHVPSSSKIHGKNTLLLLDQYAPAAYFRSGSVARTIALDPTHTLGDSWVEHGVLGLKDGTFSLNGLFDSTAGASDAVLRDLLAQEAGANLSLGLNGFAIGSLVEMAKVVAGEYRIPATLDGLVEATANFETDDAIDLGVSLHAISAETGTGNYTSVDETASTALGGVAHLHVTAFSGTDATFKVQHSTDDAIWADLITFTAVTGVGTQRGETATPTTTVNRYVRAIMSAATALSSVTFQISFARRGFTYGTLATHRALCALYGHANTQSFEYGPEGSASGKRKLSGEARLSNYTLNFGYDVLSEFTAELMVDGAVSEGTY